MSALILIGVVIVVVLALAYAAQRYMRHVEPQMTELEIEMQKFRVAVEALGVQIGQAYLPAVEKASAAMADFARAFNRRP